MTDKTWHDRIRAGLAGQHPQLPNHPRPAPRRSHRHRGVQFLASLAGSFMATAVIAIVLDNHQLASLAFVFSAICLLSALTVAVAS